MKMLVKTVYLHFKDSSMAEERNLEKPLRWAYTAHEISFGRRCSSSNSELQEQNRASDATFSLDDVISTAIRCSSRLDFLLSANLQSNAAAEDRTATPETFSVRI